MNPEKIEYAAPHLTEDERAKLDQKLLISLDSPSENAIEEEGQARRNLTRQNVSVILTIRPTLASRLCAAVRAAP